MNLRESTVVLAGSCDQIGHSLDASSSLHFADTYAADAVENGHGLLRDLSDCFFLCRLSLKELDGAVG